MSNGLVDHHYDFPLDQLELLVLADHASIDHAADVIDSECPAGETFGSVGNGNVHAAVLSWQPAYSTCIQQARRRKHPGNSAFIANALRMRPDWMPAWGHV